MQPGAESEHLRGFFFSRSQKIEVSPTLGAKFSAVDNESFEKPEICFFESARGVCKSITIPKNFELFEFQRGMK